MKVTKIVPPPIDCTIEVSLTGAEARMLLDGIRYYLTENSNHFANRLGEFHQHMRVDGSCARTIKDLENHLSDKLDKI